MIQFRDSFYNLVKIRNIEIIPSSLPTLISLYESIPHTTCSIQDISIMFDAYKQKAKILTCDKELLNTK